MWLGLDGQDGFTSISGPSWDDSTAGPLSMWSLILQGYPRLVHMVVEEFPVAREAKLKQLSTFQVSAGVKFPYVPLAKII